MGEEITLYYEKGHLRDLLVRRFNKKGLAVKLDDLGRSFPIVVQGRNSFYGMREIYTHYFPPQRNQ